MLRQLFLAALCLSSVNAFTHPTSLSAFSRASAFPSAGLGLRSRQKAQMVMKACPMSWFTNLFGGQDKEKSTAVKSVPSMAQTYMQGPLKMGSHGPLSEKELEDAREELNAIIAKGFREPVRSFMDDEDIEWRFGAAPDYSLANLLFLKGKSKNHAEGSLEQIVEDLVKSWEMEASHKKNVNQWQTITSDWTIGANGWKMYNKEESIAAGNYNVLADGCPKEVWDTSMTWDETHEQMHQAFPAFPWEVLEVFSGPPKVVFSWRHWAHFTGEYKGNKGKGELVEMYGLGVAEVSAELKLKTVEIYYKPEEFFNVLEGKMDASELNNAKTLMGPGCPFIK